MEAAVSAKTASATKDWRSLFISRCSVMFVDSNKQQK